MGTKHPPPPNPTAAAPCTDSEGPDSGVQACMSDVYVTNLDREPGGRELWLRPQVR